MIFVFAGFLMLIFSCKNGVDIFNSSDIELSQLTFSYDTYIQDWSPDGTEIIFAQMLENRRNIWKIDLTYRDVERQIISGLDIIWHPTDDNIFAFQQTGAIITKSRISTQPLTDGLYFDRQPVWSPDGNKIALTRSLDVETIWIINADGNDLKQLTTSSDGHCFSHSFNHDGTKIVYIKSAERDSGINEIWVMNSDGSNKHSLFAPGNTNQNIFKHAWNQNDKIIFSRSYPQGKKPTTASDIWIINADGSGAAPILESFSFSYENPIWNKQGNKIALNINMFVQEKSTPGSNVYYFSF